MEEESAEDGGGPVRRMYARASGRVQGVGYRQFAAGQARKLGLAGWVRNERDGSVRIAAEGPERVLRQYADYLRLGPPLGRVAALDVEWLEPSGAFASFEVRRG